MKSTVIIACAFVLVIAALESVEGQKTCKQILSELTKRQLTGMGKCTKTMKFKNGKDKAAKTMCVLKCVMTNEGVLNPTTGQMDKETFQAFIKKELGEGELAERGLTVLGKCQEQFDGKLDPNDEFCKSYDPLIKCFLNAVMQLCSGQR